MASALGQDPAGVFAAPYDHEGINDAVGDPADTSGETQAIVDFLAASVAASADPRAKLAKHPPKRLRADGPRIEVKFKLSPKSAGAEFECRLDSRKLKPCDATERRRVDGGRHTFRYRALSERGRPGSVKAFEFRVSASR